MSFAEQVGRNVAHYRRKANISQEELGARSSLHRTAVGQLERGERIPRADTLVKLAGSLGVTPGDLLDGLEWEPGGTIFGSFRDQP